MKKTLYILTATLLLVSCTKAKKTLGLTENMPDEFQVTKAKPLEVPPHFNLSKTGQAQAEKKAKKKLSPAEEAVMEETAKE
jgi:hypothetical protein